VKTLARWFWNWLQFATLGGILFFLGFAMWLAMKDDPVALGERFLLIPWVLMGGGVVVALFGFSGKSLREFNSGSKKRQSIDCDALVEARSRDPLCAAPEETRPPEQGSPSPPAPSTGVATPPAPEDEFATSEALWATVTQTSAAQDHRTVLPFVRERHRLFAAYVLGMLLLVPLTGWMLGGKPPEKDPRASDRVERRQEKDIARHQFLKFFVLPMLTVLGVAGLFSFWIEFRIDDDGLQWSYLLHKRRYRWHELHRVTVEPVSNNHSIITHLLTIEPREYGPIRTNLGLESFRVRDAMLAAAERAGVALKDPLEEKTDSTPRR
jgi:hypothetical protein